MRKIIFTTLLLVLASFVMGQNGSWYLGGVVGYASSTQKDPDDSDNKTITSSWAFSPEVGTFLSDRFQLGLALGLMGDSRKVGEDKDYTSSSFSPTIYLRHFYPITDNFSAFGAIYLGYLSGTYTDYDYSSGSEVKSKYKYSGFNGRVGIGVAYAISPRLTIVGQYGLLGFVTYTEKDGDGNKQETYSAFDFGVNTVGSSYIPQGNGSGSVFNVGIYYTICQGKE